MPRVPISTPTPKKAVPKPVTGLPEAVRRYSGPPYPSTAPSKTDPVLVAAALSLADLAERLGMTVTSVTEFPDQLALIGLPPKPEAWIVALANRLNRNAIEACLYRNNKRALEDPSWDDAKASFDRRPKVVPIPTAALVPLAPAVAEAPVEGDELFDPWS